MGSRYEQTNPWAELANAIINSKRSKYENQMMQTILTAPKDQDFNTTLQSAMIQKQPKDLLGKIFNVVNPNGSYNGQPTPMSAAVMERLISQRMQDPLDREYKQSQTNENNARAKYYEDRPTDNTGKLPGWWNYATDEERQAYLNAVTTGRDKNLGARTDNTLSKTQTEDVMRQPKLENTQARTDKTRADMGIDQRQIDIAEKKLQMMSESDPLKQQKLQAEIDNIESRTDKNQKGKVYDAKDISDKAYEVTHDKEGNAIQPSDADMFALREMAENNGYDVDVKYEDRTWPKNNAVKINLRKKQGQAQTATKETKSPYTDYPDAFQEDGVWKVVKNGKKYRIQD